MSQNVELPAPFFVLICDQCARIRRIPVELLGSYPRICTCEARPSLAAIDCGGLLRPLKPVERMFEADAWQDGQLRYRHSVR